MSELKRELGVFDAVMMGMGSIIGTGIFVSMGIAAGITGPSVIIAVAAGAGAALLNGLSSAQLAASYPVSGGTYEYGYRYLRPVLGFTAGWMFLLAKSASAATAVLGISGYLLTLSGTSDHRVRTAVSIAALLVLTVVILRGVRLSSRVNIVAVTITLSSLGMFVAAGIPEIARIGSDNFIPFFSSAGMPETDGSRTIANLFRASALMFVAFTGYGRIATLGEEVKEPGKTIPKAIVASLLFILVLYLAVTATAVGSAGSERISTVIESGSAPLIEASKGFGTPWIPAVLTVGAVTAMTGVVLNLILGLSRVLLAMGRRGDFPSFFTRIDHGKSTPDRAVITVSVLIAVLTLIGNVRVTWSFSAFSVLIYYAVTNLAALFLKRDERMYPAWTSAAGLVLCLSLAVFLDPATILTGSVSVTIGLLWFFASNEYRKRSRR